MTDHDQLAADLATANGGAAQGIAEQHAHVKRTEFGMAERLAETNFSAHARLSQRLSAIQARYRRR
jgi:hypothetical protein